jgi:SAM-dependent methyltransferase
MSAEQATDVGVRIQWAAASVPPVDAACRNCGEPGPKPVLLDAEASLPGQGRLQVRLLDCPRCGCAFAEQDRAFDYTQDASSALNIAHYVEVNAGLWPIIRTIARLPLGPGAKYLEIGCGFGFGLDYAITERGWTGRGIDPSPFAAAGRAALGLPIESRYFQPDEAVGTDADAILASEVLEHIGAPMPFLQTLRRALAPGGVLALTTPNRARLRPDVPEAELVPILSVGAHLVLETEGSLKLLLERVGFGHVATEASGDQIIAYASDAAFELPDSDAGPRTSYRAYLARRAGLATPGGFLWWGLQTRAYQESVAASDWPEAERVWPTLLSACQAGFGFDLDDPASLPDTAGLALPALRERVPGPLPNLLYLRVLHRLNGSKPPARMVDMEPLLRGAARAARDLTEALRPMAAEDQATIGVERAALAMLAASLADRADAGTLAAHDAATEADPAGEVAIARRCLVGLVNAGRTDLARQVQARHDLDAASLEAWQPGQSWDAGKRDALFCLGMLELMPDGDLALARRRFALVRALEPDGPLALPALRGERVAADRMGDTDDVAALSDAAGDAVRSSRAAKVVQSFGWRRRIGGYLKEIARRRAR